MKNAIKTVYGDVNIRNFYIDGEKTAIMLVKERGRLSNKSVFVLWVGFKFIGQYDNVDDAKKEVTDYLQSINLTYDHLTIE